MGVESQLEFSLFLYGLRLIGAGTSSSTFVATASSD
jgi:hypothetical protein